jgi:hypothetical protein
MKSRPSRMVLAVVFLTIGACASQTARSEAPASTRNTLTADEMLKAGYPDAFMTVQSLRPNWLRTHGTTSFSRSANSIKVYLDDALLGGPESLRSITMRSISMIRYLDGLQASERWGLDHSNGAIVVVTRR